MKRGTVGCSTSKDATGDPRLKPHLRTPRPCPLSCPASRTSPTASVCDRICAAPSLPPSLSGHRLGPPSARSRFWKRIVLELTSLAPVGPHPVRAQSPCSKRRELQRVHARGHVGSWTDAILREIAHPHHHSPSGRRESRGFFAPRTTVHTYAATLDYIPIWFRAGRGRDDCIGLDWILTPGAFCFGLGWGLVGRSEVRATKSEGVAYVRDRAWAWACEFRSSLLDFVFSSYSPSTG